MSNVCVTITSNDLTVICGISGPQGARGLPGLPFTSVMNPTVSGPITAEQNSTLFTNTGATGEIDLALPVALDPFVPLAFSLLITAAHEFRFTLPDGVVITNGDNSSLPGGYLTSNVVNNFVTIIMVSPTQWIIALITGIWDLE